MQYRKYKAVKTEIDGIKFDSKIEAKRYEKLKQLERDKIIESLELQPKFLLQPSFDKNGIKYRKIEYIADFRYKYPLTGEEVIEDVKGIETETFKIKRKLFEYTYPEKKLRIVKRANE